MRKSVSPLPAKRIKKWLKQTPAITEMRTLSCPQARHFTCFFSFYSGHLSTSSKILTRITYRIKRRLTIKELENDTMYYRPLLLKRVNKWLLYSILGRKDIAIRAYKHFALFQLSTVKVVRQRTAKNDKKHYIWQQVNILAIHVTGGVSVWFFKPFLMYPLTLQELGSDNTAYRKISKISPGAYIFQRPFLRGLHSEGLIYGGKFAF